MTNEQKSKEIYNKYKYDKNLNKLATESAAFNAAMEMAEWKEMQIKQYLLHGKEFAQEKGNQDLAELFEIIIEDLKL